MKSWFLAFISLVLLQVAQALEPGRYLISCTEVLTGVDRNKNERTAACGYLLTVGKDGKNSLEMAKSPDETNRTIHVEEVTITEDKTNGMWLLRAKIVSVVEGTDSEGNKHKESNERFLSLMFGSRGLGDGSVIGLTDGLRRLEAQAGLLPEAQPSK